MNNHTLYICYFGVREPLVQTQVLPYLREIGKLEGMKTSILTFEPDFKNAWTKEQIALTKKDFAAEGIDWYVLPYHKRPSVPATLYDVFCGVRLIRKLIKSRQINILHARVHVPALMGAIAKKLTGNKVKLVFDIRGFFPEEYTDAGNWKENGLIYKTVKRIEKWLFKVSDGFIVLTEKARMILFPESLETNEDKYGRPVEVIPCCVNLERFNSINDDTKQEIKKKLGIENRKVITYVGSLGTWYLAEEMTDLMKTAKEQDSSFFAMILTQSDPKIVSEKLKAKNYTDEDFFVKKIPHSEVSYYLSAADSAISFIKPCYSKLSSSPTKIAEYLASGIPIITNRGVGDVAEQIEADGVGAIIEDFSPKSYTKALLEIEQLQQAGNLSERCQASARKNFDLEKVGGEKYRNFYRRLLAKE